MSDLISRNEVINIIHKKIQDTSDFLQHDALIDVEFEVDELPTVEAVPKSYAEQIRWERDVAVGQLNEIGCQFGQKMDEVKKLEAVPVVHCKECKNWHKDIGWCDKHSHFIDSDGSFCHPWESSNWKMFDENDFCSDGERRENETD